jgi:hypothetical protein
MNINWGPLLLISGFLTPMEDIILAFVRVFGQWIRFDDCRVEVVNESVILGENFPETAPSSQTATTLLYVLDTTEHAIL